MKIRNGWGRVCARLSALASRRYNGFHLRPRISLRCWIHTLDRCNSHRPACARFTRRMVYRSSRVVGGYINVLIPYSIQTLQTMRFLRLTRFSNASMRHATSIRSFTMSRRPNRYSLGRFRGTPFARRSWLVRGSIRPLLILARTLTTSG